MLDILGLVQAKKHTKSRILHGKAVKKHTFPWAVSIWCREMYVANPRTKHCCGGSLICKKDCGG